MMYYMFLDNKLNEVHKYAKYCKSINREENEDIDMLLDIIIGITNEQELR